jgi:hypothetical protein
VFHLLLGADGLLLTTSVVLAASLEAVGADLEVTSVGSACSVGASLDLEGLGGLVGTGLVVGAPRVTAGVTLAAASEAVGAGLEEAGSGRADGIVRSLGRGRGADWLLLTTSITLAAATETVGAGLEEAGAGRADSIVTLGLLSVRGADGLLLTACIVLAAASETVGARLEETRSRSTLTVGKACRSGLRNRLGSSSSCLRLPLVTVNVRVGNDRSFRLSDEDKIASLGSKVAAPLCVARVFGAPPTEAVLTADIVLD